MSQTWLVSGASRGFGRHLTERLLERGDRVAATARDPSRLGDLVARYENQVWARALDVSDPVQVRAVVDAAFAELGRIDVVVSNAGSGSVGAAEELSDEQVTMSIATNFTGSIQLARAVAPHLRAQGGGRILQLSSMGGFIGAAGWSLYCSTKWGIEGFFECFAGEVAPFGIRTTCIEPGRIRTSFYGAVNRASPLAAYDESETWRGGFDDVHMPGDQSKVVQAMIDVAAAADPPRRLLLGSDAYQLVREALTSRLAAFDAQKELAYSTDADEYNPSPM